MAELSTLRGQPQAGLACPLGSLCCCRNSACGQENILTLPLGAAGDPGCRGTALEHSMQQHELGVLAGARLGPRAWWGLGWCSYPPPLPKSLLCPARWALGRAVATLATRVPSASQSQAPIAPRGLHPRCQKLARTRRWWLWLWGESLGCAYAPTSALISVCTRALMLLSVAFPLCRRGVNMAASLLLPCMSVCPLLSYYKCA